ncbi:membrane metallo-endopeptidase-like 1 [Haemaphysalis longicornis]
MVIGAALIILLVVVLLLVWLRSGSSVFFCKTECCLTHAKELNAAMDTSVSPCDDFHRFTCGSLVRKDKEDSMVRRIFRESARIAVAEMENTKDPALPAAAMYYQTCVKKRTPEDLKGEIDAFTRFKQDVGLMWPEKEQREKTHPLKLLLNLSINWNYHMLFNLRAFPQYRGRPATLYIRRGKLHHEWLKDALEGFSERVKQHCRELNATELSEKHIKEVYDAVRNMTKQSQIAPPGTTKEREIPLKNTTSYMPSRSRLLMEYVNELHRPDFTWNDESPLFLEDPKILTNLDSLLEHFKERVSLLLKGFSWVFIQENLWVVVGKPDLLPKGSKAGLQTACLRFVEESFGLVVMAKHIRTRYDEALRETLKRIFSTTGAQVMKAVERSGWIEAAVKQKVHSKLAAIGLNALPSEHFFAPDGLTTLYKDFSADVSTLFMQNYINFAKAYRRIIGLNDYIEVYSKRQSGGAPSRYNYYYNIAFLSLGALQPPILYQSGSLAMIYGSLGTLLAECMVRSFDTHGVLVDEKGNSSVWWWNPNSTDYKKRAECDLLGANLVNPNEDQKQQLLSALFPLPPALAASYAALRKAAADGTREYENAYDVRLGNLEKFTDAQVFFLTYCLMTCSYTVLDKLKCNVPLQHTRAFAQAFQCPPGTRMNPTDKCEFFA